MVQWLKVVRVEVFISLVTGVGYLIPVTMALFWVGGQEGSKQALKSRKKHLANNFQ